jgi:hypothetical protein
MIGFTGWFNSFDINNWHGSLRKMKNCNKGKSWKRDFLDNCPAEMSVHFFSKEWKERQKGLIAKINANKLCQRKLF